MIVKKLFNSKWCQSRYFIDLNINNYLEKISVIKSTLKTKINFKNKKYNFFCWEIKHFKRL